jgi:hypothetical protein
MRNRLPGREGPGKVREVGKHAPLWAVWDGVGSGRLGHHD